MKFGAILVIALGLAMDATAVSAARGMAAPRIRVRHVLLVALLFGGFQAIMPLIGWVIGSRLGPLVETWDHWVVFGFLTAIGIKMLWDAGQRRDPKPLAERRRFGLRVMFVLAVATSIDALAVGVTLPMLNAPLLLSVVTIGVTTAVLSAVGLTTGRRLGTRAGTRLDLLGGVVLIGIGTKILIQHLAAQ